MLQLIYDNNLTKKLNIQLTTSSACPFWWVVPLGGLFSSLSMIFSTLPTSSVPSSTILLTPFSISPFFGVAVMSTERLLCPIPILAGCFTLARHSQDQTLTTATKHNKELIEEQCPVYIMPIKKSADRPDARTRPLARAPSMRSPLQTLSSQKPQRVGQGFTF